MVGLLLSCRSSSLVFKQLSSGTWLLTSAAQLELRTRSLLFHLSLSALRCLVSTLCYLLLSSLLEVQSIIKKTVRDALLTDTFASRIAAMSERTADSAIGNVTGSNAVNVFLGIGLAWTIAAVAHAIKGEPFRVDPGNLAFAVILFLALALVAIGLLLVRRVLRIHGQRGELGGCAPSRYVSAALFIGLWFFYLAVSSLESFCVFRV